LHGSHPCSGRAAQRMKMVKGSALGRGQGRQAPGWVWGEGPTSALRDRCRSGKGFSSLYPFRWRRSSEKTRPQNFGALWPATALNLSPHPRGSESGPPVALKPQTCKQRTVCATNLQITRPPVARPRAVCGSAAVTPAGRTTQEMCRHLTPRPGSPARARAISSAG
jgi:hypothetical protein